MNNLDVHGLTLIQAKKVIIKAITDSYRNGISVLNINHGFNNGNKIKSWCLRELTNQQYVIKVDSGENEGISKVYIQINLMKG